MENKTKPLVTVLLPAFNEDTVIGKTIEEIKKLHPDFEILVVDDGSKDTTMAKAMDAGANVWPHPYNMGNGASIKSGLRCARGQWVLMMDADGQHDPHEIADLLKFKDQYDMVVGARDWKASGIWHRNIANWFYNRLASYMTRIKIQDLTSGFRLVRKDTARMFIHLLPNGFSYPTTITMAYLRSGRSVKYVPITCKKRKGKSKIKLFQDGTRFLLIIARIATLYSPLRIFFPLSLFIFLTGIFYYLYTFITNHRFTNMSALLITTSIVIFMIGLVSEQVSQMRYDRVD